MTIEQTDDMDLCNVVLNLPEVLDAMMLRPDQRIDIRNMVHDDALLFIFRDADKKPVGLIWLDREQEPGEKEHPYVAHIALARSVRGRLALKVITGAINHCFYRSGLDVVYAKAPYKRSHMLLKQLGWEDVRIEEKAAGHLGVIARRVMRLRKKNWESRIAHKPFFIVGYPRSGTAWVANLLTNSGALCLHEGQRFGPHLDIWLYSAPMRGNADPSQIILTDLIQTNTDSPVVWIVRDRTAAIRSFVEYTRKNGMDISGGVDALFDRLDAAHDLILSGRDNVLKVDFDKLFTLESAKKIWRHCLPELPFDMMRAKLLCGFNVQQDMRKAFLPEVNPLMIEEQSTAVRVRDSVPKIDDWYRVTPAPGT